MKSFVHFLLCDFHYLCLFLHDSESLLDLFEGHGFFVVDYFEVVEVLAGDSEVFFCFFVVIAGGFAMLLCFLQFEANLIM